MLRARPKQLAWTGAIGAPIFAGMTMHQQIDTHPATTPREARRRRRHHGRLPLVLITMCLGVFLAQLDTSVVNLALGRIGGELGSSVAQLQWVVDGYNLTYASCPLTGGRSVIFSVAAACS
jgi:hypothetical protein